MIMVEKPLHMNAKKEDIANIVLMPGDPLRAKYIAEKFLTDAKLVTNIRNMSGYTGYYKNKKVTIMGSGMGMPSMSIYSFELFHFYDVEKIIRIGTCGVLTPDIDVTDVVLAQYAYTETNFSYSYDKTNRNIIYPSDRLNSLIIGEAKNKNMKIHVGGMVTCEVFGPYIENFYAELPKGINPIAEEMEAFALMYVAKSLNKEATCLATVTDSKYSSKELTPEEREKTLDNMIMLALDAIVK